MSKPRMESFLDAVRNLRDCITKVHFPQILPNAHGAETAWPWVNSAQQSRTQIREGLGQFLQSVTPPGSLASAQWAQTILKDVDDALVAMRRVITLACGIDDSEPVPTGAPSQVVTREEAEELRKKYQQIIQEANKVGFADTDPVGFLLASHFRDGFKHLVDGLTPIGHDPQAGRIGIPELDDLGSLYEKLAQINHRLGEVVQCADYARDAAGMVQQKVPVSGKKQGAWAKDTEPPLESPFSKGPIEGMLWELAHRVDQEEQWIRDNNGKKIWVQGINARHFKAWFNSETKYAKALDREPPKRKTAKRGETGRKDKTSRQEG